MDLINFAIFCLCMHIPQTGLFLKYLRWYQKQTLLLLNMENGCLKSKSQLGYNERYIQLSYLMMTPMRRQDSSKPFSGFFLNVGHLNSAKRLQYYSFLYLLSIKRRDFSLVTYTVMPRLMMFRAELN